MTSDLSANVGRFDGVAECYDAHRPTPPSVIIDILTQIAGVERPKLVVDLGSGTGLSTRIWADRAEEVIGVEPNQDMRNLAENSPRASENVRYRDGLSTQTGLTDGCADIVTASQAMHWMEPEPTFAEAVRILRTGGLLAAYDCDWPPTMNWQAEAAYRAFLNRVRMIEDEHRIYDDVKRWKKKGHLERMEASGRFRYVRKLSVHGIESGNAERLVQLALSQGSVSTLLRRGVSEQALGLDRLRAEAQRTLGDEPVPWCFSYTIQLGVK
ncbi:MAG: class I SAM-dependent methyltransferase [Phycisphaerae bacterium]|nr:class I SAM-dependent methyltransferase [Phycisphaerae bacterium]